MTVVYAIVGIAIATICDSMTLIVDGLYSVVDVIVSLLAIFIVRRIHEPPNENYQYGYAKYEPFMTAVEGLLIMAICAGSIVISIQDIIHPEPVKHIHLIIVYSFVSVFICIGFGLYMKTAAKKISSEVLAADSQLWIIEGVVSAGVCIAFALHHIRYHWDRYADFVDPVMSIILHRITVMPIQIVAESFRDSWMRGRRILITSIWKKCFGDCEKYGLTGIMDENAQGRRRIF